MYQHIKNQTTSLFHSRDIVDLKVLESNWPRPFWPKSQETDFSQTWNLRKNTKNKLPGILRGSRSLQTISFLMSQKQSSPPNNVSTYKLNCYFLKVDKLVNTMNTNNTVSVRFSNVLLTWHKSKWWKKFKSIPNQILNTAYLSQYKIQIFNQGCS